jgi:hypothetical protein
MGYERLAWVGNVVLAAIAIFLAWVPASHQVGKWGTVAIAVLVVVAAITLFPRRRSDGSTARLIDGFRASVKGDNNRVQIARDNANQVMGGGRIRDDDSKSDG